MSEKKQIELKVTTVKELKEYSHGAIVELPPFGNGQPFVAMLKMPSILGLVSKNALSNKLLSVATDLFMSETGVDRKDPNALINMNNIFTEMAKDCFVKPTYEEIEQSELRLTDQQLAFVFNYSQRGVTALEPFRK